MYKIFSIVVLVLLPVLSGCSGTDLASNLVQLPTGEIVSAATDRFGSWERVETRRAEVDISKNNLEIAKLAKQAAEPQVVISIDSAAEMESYERLQSINALKAANESLSRVAVALAEKDKSVVAEHTSFPKGVIAESFEGLGEGINRAGNTPATMILSTGVALGSFMGAVDQGARVDSGGGDVSLVTEKTHSVASDSSSIANQPRQDNSVINPVEPAVE